MKTRLLLTLLVVTACTPVVRHSRLGPNRYSIKVGQSYGSKQATMTAAHQRAVALCPGGYETDDAEHDASASGNFASTALVIKCNPENSKATKPTLTQGVPKINKVPYKLKTITDRFTKDEKLMVGFYAGELAVVATAITMVRGTRAQPATVEMAFQAAHQLAQNFGCKEIHFLIDEAPMSFPVIRKESGSGDQHYVVHRAVVPFDSFTAITNAGKVEARLCGHEFVLSVASRAGFKKIGSTPKPALVPAP